MCHRSLASLLVLLMLFAVAEAKPKRKRPKPTPTAQAQQQETAQDDQKQEEDPFKLEVEFEEKPAPSKSPYAFTVARHKWDRDQPAVKTIGIGEGFCFLAELTGNMLGGGESVAVAPGFDGNYYLSCTSQQPLSASAVSIATKLRGEFEREGKEYTWNKDDPPVKMIHKSEGLCYLSNACGAFKGYGESVRVYINPKDGFWYLEGSAVQFVVAKATALKLRKGSKVKLEYTEHAWSRGQEPVKLIAKDDGFAYLSSVAGNFQGFGEQVSVGVGDGFWQLSGHSQQDLAARAISVRVRK